MGRRYVLTANNFTSSNAATSVLAAFQPAAANAAASIIEVERVEVSQSGSTTSGQCNLAFLNIQTSGTTLTMTSTTPSPLVMGGPASGLAGGTGITTAAKAGTVSSAFTNGGSVTIANFNFNNLGGFLWQPIPQDTIIVVPGIIFAVAFVSAPTGTTGWTVSVYFHEIF